MTRRRETPEDAFDEDAVLDDSDDDEIETGPRFVTGLGWFVGGVLLGTVVGAGAALLLAPARGATTRRRMRHRWRDLREDAREGLGDLREGASRGVARRRRRLRRRAR